MSFRKIRPSFGDSSSTPGPSTSESTGSDPRKARGEKEQENSSGKRRRVPESVTRNACVNCKKARAKCDGKKPCKRCSSRLETSECVYEVHIKHAKEELVKEIKVLRAKDHLTEQIIQALSSDGKVPEIIERLKNDETYEAIVEWLGRSPVVEETVSPRESQHSTFEASDHEMDGSISTAFRWTSVTLDVAAFHHLFQLYFAWVHPVHTLFSEGHFVESYQHQSANYCSPLLVNAICALACHLHSAADTDEVDYEHLGTDFSDAVKAELDPDDTSITSIQAFAVMFLVECSHANGLRAASYLRIATDNISRVPLLDDEGFKEAWGNTVRGLDNLNAEWAQMTFQVPQSTNVLPVENTEDIERKLDDANWYFYRFVNDECPAWPGLLTTTNREKSKLTAIITDVTAMMYAQRGPPITAHQVLVQYHRFVAWREDLPGFIGNIEHNNSQALPHVLSLLILYSNSVVQLLRPLLDLEGFPSVLVEEIIWSNAQQGLFLLDQHYRTQYTCQFQPVLQMFAVLHLIDVIARFFPLGVEIPSKDGASAIQFGLEVLMESRAGFPIAGPFQEMLRRTAIDCSIRLPKNLDDLMAIPRQNTKQVYRIDDMINACTRATYVQPVAAIHKKYSSTFSADWVSDGAKFGFHEPAPGARRLRGPSAEERGAQSLMQIRNLLNTN